MLRMQNNFGQFVSDEDFPELLDDKMAKDSFGSKSDQGLWTGSLHARQEGCMDPLDLLPKNLRNTPRIRRKRGEAEKFR